VPISTAVVRFQADRGDTGRRLDHVLAARLGPTLFSSRTRLQAWLADGAATVNGRTIVRCAHRLRAGDAVLLTLPREPAREPPSVVPQPMPLEVLYEDDEILALNKPAGCLVHPTAREREGTVLNGLRWRAGIRGDCEAGYVALVHRLDRDTSGVLIAAKTRAARAALGRALERRQVYKEYIACVWGTPARPWGRITLRIGRDPADSRRMRAHCDEGREAVTWWQHLASSEPPGLSLLRCRLLSGRTHQIRVHLAATGSPLIGDSLYGRNNKRVSDAALAAMCSSFPRQALHAFRVVIRRRGNRFVTIEAPVPHDLQGLLRMASIDLAVADMRCNEGFQERLDIVSSGR
jgi:23S rRNA pseudouridine1911/1915/1917 synthase